MAIEIEPEDLFGMKYIMSDPAGRAWVHRHMGAFGLYQSVLSRKRPWIRDDERAVYNAAQQEIAQSLHTEAVHCDGLGSLYQKMQSEAEARRVKKNIDEEQAKLRKRKETDDGGTSGSDPSGDELDPSRPGGDRR